MGAILSLLGTAIPFGGVIIAGVAALGIGFYASERVEISGLNKEITTLHVSIDGPTGYIAQLGRANANLAVANANIADLTKNVSALNAEIDGISVASAAAVKRTKALQVALSDAQAKARSVTMLLEAQRPQQASYAALTGLIRQPVSLAVGQ